MTKDRQKSVLAQKLKEYRKKAGMTQEELSQTIGINRSAYAYYEIGTTTPKPETICKLAKLYNISTDELLSVEKPDVSQVEISYRDNLPIIDVAFNELSNLEKKMVVKMRLMSTSQLREFIDIMEKI